MEKTLAVLPGYLVNAINAGAIDNFKIILLSIVLEALPFVLLSVFVSAVLHNFVSDTTIQKIIPRNKWLSIIPATLLGLLFPVCDCGMVAIVRRLVTKGVPLHTAIAFMLASPIINPVVALSTAFAFRTNPSMVILRLGVAFLVACLISFFISIIFTRSQLRRGNSNFKGCGCHQDSHDLPSKRTLIAKLGYTIRDAGGEFFDMGKYLIVGAMLGAGAQVLLPRTLLTSVGLDPVVSIGAMLAFAFFISVCSSADSFIAASFVTSFSPGSLVAFMVFGPMMDLKNTLMLLQSFRFRFVVWLLLTTTCLCAIAAYLINLL
jgi:hypothetical protein